MQKGSIKTIRGGAIKALGHPPKELNNSPNQDWVVLVKRID
ncbi:hypothetical protein [Winogradskyella sp. PG-2]|nr:hypothetical protein [Winogradskyella sp. PG-2]BAO76523.1 hypothetical protein WPG_2293 [Winogradskyella sp. PG-2]